MLRRVLGLGLIGMIVLLAGLAWQTGSGGEPGAAREQPLDPREKQEKEETLAQAQAKHIQRLLEDPIEMKDFQAQMTLKEFIGLLYEKFAAKGVELPIIADTEAFREENPEADDVYETAIRLPPYPKRMTMSKALRMALNRVPTRNATFLVRPGYLEITTWEHARPERRAVQATFAKRPLVEALEELSALTGISIVLDARAGDKGKMPLTASFRNETSLVNAVRVLADMADLKLVVVDNVMYVTLRSNTTEFPPVGPPGFGGKRDIVAQ